MKNQTVKRQVLIREYDFNQIRRRALKLYDRVRWEPLLRDQLEKEYVLNLLKNTQARSANPQWPREFLESFGDRLYNKDYAKWQCVYDDQGYLWIQYGSNTPKTRLGRAFFEKDFK